MWFRRTQRLTMYVLLYWLVHPIYPLHTCTSFFGLRLLYALVPCPPPSTPPCRGFRSKGLPSNRAYFLTTMLSISPMASDPRRTTLSTPDTYYIHRRQTCFSFVHATQADVQVNLLHRPNAPSRIHRPLPAPTWGPSMFTTIFFPARKFSPPTGAKQVVYR